MKYKLFQHIVCALTLITSVSAYAAQEWKEGEAYQQGEVVSYQGHDYLGLSAHTAWVGANWNPSVSPSLWQDIGKSEADPELTNTDTDNTAQIRTDLLTGENQFEEISSEDPDIRISKSDFFKSASADGTPPIAGALATQPRKPYQSFVYSAATAGAGAYNNLISFMRTQMSTHKFLYFITFQGAVDSHIFLVDLKNGAQNQARLIFRQNGYLIGFYQYATNTFFIVRGESLNPSEYVNNLGTSGASVRQLPFGDNYNSISAAAAHAVENLPIGKYEVQNWAQWLSSSASGPQQRAQAILGFALTFSESARFHDIKSLMDKIFKVDSSWQPYIVYVKDMNRVLINNWGKITSLLLHKIANHASTEKVELIWSVWNSAEGKFDTHKHTVDSSTEASSHLAVSLGTAR